MQAWALTVLVALCGSCVAHADARRVTPDGAVGDASTVCDANAKQVLDALNDKDDLGKLHYECTHILLYLGYKHQTPEEAKAYCKSEACIEFVKRLKEYPACTWKDIPSDSDGKLLSAQRVLEDCG